MGQSFRPAPREIKRCLVGGFRVLIFDMKTRTQVALAAVLISLIAHVYLTLHYYPLKFGLAVSASACNLSATFNCDSVATSAYASFLGIPLSLWGAATQAVLFYLILMGWLEWSDHPERTRRFSLGLAGASAIGSLVMGLISLLFLKSYCIVCIGLYVLSFVTFLAVRGTLREPFWMHLRRDLPATWSESRGLLIALALIPILAVVGHQSFLANYGGDQVAAAVRDSMTGWQAAPHRDFVAKPSLALGPAEGAALTLVEFADFRCGHCRHASYSLDAFVRSHPDVRFEFYVFPLDGACNEKIEHADGLSCRLADAVHCAEKEAKGWALHHALFEAQDAVNQTNSAAELDQIISREASSLDLNWERLQTCMADSNTRDAIKAQAKQGSLVNVMGTPTIFANGRQLPRAQLVPVLEAARDAALATK